MKRMYGLLATSLSGAATLYGGINSYPRASRSDLFALKLSAMTVTTN